jgi:tetratricopeptide (TPR) repeat protein
MAKILRFPDQVSAKYDFKRAKRGRKRKKVDLEDYGQLNLFSGKKGQIFELHSQFSPFEEALILDESGDEGAREAYLKAISEGDSVPDAYCNLGILESRAGNASRAVDCFAKSLKEDSRHFESHFNLGNLYFDSGDFQLARLHYEIASQISPGYANVFFNLGLVLAETEEYKLSVAALNTYKSLVSEKESAKADNLLESLEKSLVMQN